MSAKLSKLIARREKIKNQIETEVAKERTLERKRDTRRKILIGAYVIQKAEKEGTLESLKREVVEYLDRDGDKKLFLSNSDD